jgi:hypothetical protein
VDEKRNDTDGDFEALSMPILAESRTSKSQKQFTDKQATSLK